MGNPLLSRMTRPSLVIIAIDGGAASGKSSTSRALSARFNLLHVDTGSFYRAIAAELLARGVPHDDINRLRKALSALDLGTQIEGNSARMTICGQAIEASQIRTPEVNASVSLYAAIPEVREALLQYQRNQAKVAEQGGFPGLIMEGRDIGTVIFPNAQHRIFLHADPEARARRRALEGQTDSITERDRMDSQRKTAPLTCPPGAWAIDSTDLSLEQVVALISKRLQESLKAN